VVSMHFEVKSKKNSPSFITFAIYFTLAHLVAILNKRS
jgi:hypothetical protein